MGKEIEILLEANSNGNLIVEKETHALWERNELLEAQHDGRFQEEELLLPPEPQVEVSGPYPGCVPGAAGISLNYRLLGQTKHFVIFFPTEGSVPPMEGESR